MLKACRWARWNQVASSIMSIARREYGQDADDAYQNAALTWHLFGDSTLLDAQIIVWAKTTMRRSTWRSRRREMLADDGKVPALISVITPYHIVSSKEILVFIDQNCTKKLKTACYYLALGETIRSVAKMVELSESRLSRELLYLRKQINLQTQGHA